MPHSVFIDGAAGTTGLEIAERLARREDFELIVLDEARRKDEAARREALNEADFAILCLPDEAAREAVALLDPHADTRVIDASSAHRVADGWTYGFPELIGRTRIAGAMRVSNPGCYPTGFLALLAPLTEAGLLPRDWPYTVNAVSGYSGGGKALIERFEQERDMRFRAYGLQLGHKHLPEMQAFAGLAYPPVFSPAVIGAMRGMVVDIPLPLAAMPGTASPDTLRTTLRNFYQGSDIVSVQDLADPPVSEILLMQDATAWDGIVLEVHGDEQGTQARLVATLDNLGKGASGAAIQNLNLMAGLGETVGLHLAAA